MFNPLDTDTDETCYCDSQIIAELYEGGGVKYARRFVESDDVDIDFIDVALSKVGGQINTHVFSNEERITMEDCCATTMGSKDAERGLEPSPHMIKEGYDLSEDDMTDKQVGDYYRSYYSSQTYFLKVS